MRTSLNMVLMSHLSDIQTGLVNNPQVRINFIKFLLMKYSDNSENPLDRYFEIDPDADYKEFENKHLHNVGKLNGPSQNEPTDESRLEFDKAIFEHRLSSDSTAANYAGHYMYMGKNENGKSLFKHFDTRRYID